MNAFHQIIPLQDENSKCDSPSGEQCILYYTIIFTGLETDIHHEYMEASF